MKTDMTSGSPAKHIIVFTIPLLIGNVFQQFYNMADTLIVGRFLGVDALAAVGSAGSIVFLITGFATGLTAGFSIILAQHYGASDIQAVKKDFAASIIMSMAVILVLTIVSLLLGRTFLQILNTPENIIEEASQYINVIYGGMFATILFNLLSNVLRALGDSRLPLIFLMIACVINIILDIAFIAVFHMGVEGAAYATIIAQIFAVLCCVHHIVKKIEILHLNRESFYFIPDYVKKQIVLGLSMGFQSSIISIGGIFVQAALNQLGSVYVASYTAAQKIESIAHMPMLSFGLTMGTYVGQNYGASNLIRIKKGVYSCLAMSVSFSVVMGVINMLFGYQLAAVFVPGETSVLENAHTYLSISGCLYFVLAILYIIRYSLQGIGKSAVPTFAGIMELFMRAMAAVVLSQFIGFRGICWANPLAWIGSCIPLCIAYIFYISKMNQDPKYQLNCRDTALTIKSNRGGGNI